MKKKFLYVIIFLSICLIVTGCGKDSNKNEDNDSDKKTQEYILETRKKAYVNTAYKYVNAVITEVNVASNFKFFDEDTLYLVKVGHEEGCVSLNVDGKSPFNDKWKYAYVGVIYKGYNYDYYFMSEDESGYGIAFSKEDDLDFEDVVTDTPDYSNDLYTNNGSKVYMVEYDNKTSKNKLFSGHFDYNEFIKESEIPRTNKLSELADLVPTKSEGNSTVAAYNYIVIINPTTSGTCSYSR